MIRFKALLDEFDGMDHDDPDCPCDDTCECENVARVNAAYTELERLVDRVDELEARVGRLRKIVRCRSKDCAWGIAEALGIMEGKT